MSCRLYSQPNWPPHSLFERRLEALRFLEAALKQAFKEAVGEQVHVFGEQAEHALHKEVGGVVRFVATITQGLGKYAELFGDFFGDRFSGDGRLERIRISEDTTHEVEGAGLGEIFE